MGWFRLGFAALLLDVHTNVYVCRAKGKISKFRFTRYDRKAKHRRTDGRTDVINFRLISSRNDGA